MKTLSNLIDKRVWDVINDVIIPSLYKSMPLCAIDLMELMHINLNKERFTYMICTLEYDDNEDDYDYEMLSEEQNQFWVWIEYRIGKFTFELEVPEYDWAGTKSFTYRATISEDELESETCYDWGQLEDLSERIGELMEFRPTAYTVEHGLGKP